jgi:hypothetical protein
MASNGTALQGDGSATSGFSFEFSSSRIFSRFISNGIRTPYLLHQLQNLALAIVAPCPCKMSTRRSFDVLDWGFARSPGSACIEQADAAFSAALISGLRSYLSGQSFARATSSVYVSPSERYLLI